MKKFFLGLILGIVAFCSVASAHNGHVVIRHHHYVNPPRYYYNYNNYYLYSVPLTYLYPLYYNGMTLYFDPILNRYYYYYPNTGQRFYIN